MSNTNIHRLFATPKVKAHSSNRQTKPARKKVNRSMLPLLVKVANAEDEATSDGWDVFHYRKFLNRKGIIQIPRDKACNVKEVIQQLVSKNADIRFGDPETEGVVTRAVEAPPKEHWLYARHLGWRPNRKAYVLQNRVIGSSTARLKVKPSRWVTDRQLSTVGQAGDLANWQKRIAAVSRYSTRIMLLMSAAWAAPLLEIIKLQPFSINLFGRAKSGKTTALLAATSIIGIGTESQLPNWNTTECIPGDSSYVQ